MTTDEAWERIWKATGMPLPRIDDTRWFEWRVMKAELDRILADVRRETVQACAAKCIEIWNLAPNTRESGFRHNQISHGCLACKDAILALVPKEDGR